MNFKLYEEFLNEGEEKFIPQDLALITLRYLYRKTPDNLLNREVFLSQFDREAIAREWGDRLPRGFAGPDSGMNIGSILAPAIYNDPSWRNKPYYDDVDLVFGSYPLVFRSKVSPKDPVTRRNHLTSTWKELGDWLKEKMATKENLLDLWLDSNLSLPEFRETYKGRILGGKYGLS